MSRCTGHCCKNFWLPLSPMEVAFQGKLADHGKSRWNLEDMKKIRDMVVYLRPDKEKGHRYTCKHFDASTGNCTNYTNRPTMCANFPYGKPCPYKKCTMTEEEGCK